MAAKKYHTQREKDLLTVQHAKSYMSKHDEKLRAAHGSQVIDHLLDCLEKGLQPHMDMELFKQNCWECFLDGTIIEAGIKRACALSEGQ